MNLIARLQALLRPVVFLGRNAITLTGAVLTTSSGITLAVFLVLELFVSGRHARPYEGIILYGILPVIFVTGLLMMPIGAIWRRISLNKKGQLQAGASLKIYSEAPSKGDARKSSRAAKSTPKTYKVRKGDSLVPCSWPEAYSASPRWCPSAAASIRAVTAYTGAAEETGFPQRIATGFCGSADSDGGDC